MKDAWSGTLWADRGQSDPIWNAGFMRFDLIETIKLKNNVISGGYCRGAGLAFFVLYTSTNVLLKFSGCEQG